MEDEREVDTDTDVGTNEQQVTSTTETLDTRYEGMCISLYAYRYGAIGFLELLAKFEETLGLQPPQTISEKTLA